MAGRKALAGSPQMPSFLKKAAQGALFKIQIQKKFPVHHYNRQAIHPACHSISV